MTSEKGIKVYRMLLGGNRNQQPVIFAQNGDEKNATDTYDPALDAYQIFLFLNCEIPAITKNALVKLLDGKGTLTEMDEIRARLAKREEAV